jgi:putative spermidine/putrescine transport system permease protein
MISRRNGLLLVAPLALALVVFFLLPILALVPVSFETYVPGSGIARGVWTLSNYTQLVTDDYYREVIWRTLGLGFAVTFACLVLGYPLAYLIARGPERWRVPLTLLVIFPMMLNLVVRSFGWIAILANRGLVNNLLLQLGLIARPTRLIFNFTGVMIGSTHIYLPFMVLMLAAAIRSVPRDVEAAAATLGSSQAHVFFAVTLPLTAPGVLAGSILVFVLNVSALVVPRMLGGPTYTVMATLIYDEFMQLLDWPSGAALSFALTFIAVGVIWISSRLARRWAGAT